MEGSCGEHGRFGRYLNLSLQSLASQSAVLKPVFAAWAIDNGDGTGVGEVKQQV